MWLLIFSFLLILPLHYFTSDWIKRNNDDCPDCLVYVTDTNFTSIISFESKVLLGARNSIYQINFLEESADKYDDKSQPAEFETCKNKFGQQIEDCQNYYKVILRLNPSDLFICGTSAYNPVCMVRTKSDLSYSTQIGDGIGICPANPRSSTTYLKLKDSHYGFAGTERASSNEYAISLINLRYGSYQVEATTKSNNHWLKKPDFVYSFEYEDYVYFILKEIAVEVLNIEQIYSRIVRICKDDRGGANPFFTKNFMTFLKARLFCSYTKAGQSPYDFNEIGGAHYLDGHLYGLFSGPSSVIETGSVLCKFDMKDIAKVFDGKAKYFDRGTFHDEDEAKPFSCVDGRSTQDALKHQLMANAITASSPIFYSPLQMKRLTISKVTVSGETSIIAHAGTLTGVVIRVGFKNEREYEGTVRHRQLMLGTGPILELSVPEDDDTAVFVMSHNWVGYLPLFSPCHIHTTCQSCQTSFPSCGWCHNGDMNNKCSTKLDCAAGAWHSPYSSCPALPSFTATPLDKVATLTDDQPVKEVEFRCVSRQHDIKPTWTKLSGQISTSAKYLEGGNVLRIRTERYTDTGTYICNLQGEAGHVQSMATLTVLVTPSFTYVYDDPNITTSPGEDVILTCRSDGNPKPITTWYKKNSVELPEGAKKEGSGDLKIIRTVKQDAGSYYCEISNGVGDMKRSKVINLSVTAENKSGPDSEKSSDSREPFDYKKMIIIVCGVIIVAVVIGILVHLIVQKRRCQKAHQGPGTMPYAGMQTYHEQTFADFPHTPNSIATPDYLEEQMHFEWGQQIPLSHTNHLVPNRQLSQLEEEPPPAYHAEIELHQPPIPVRRPVNPPEHFFTPVVTTRTETPPSSGYSAARTTPERGPTPPSRSNIVNTPPSRMIISPGTSEQDDLISSTDNMPNSLDRGDINTLSDDPSSCHEYERIGLLNSDNSNNNNSNINSSENSTNNNSNNNNPNV